MPTRVSRLIGVLFLCVAAAVTYFSLQSLELRNQVVGLKNEIRSLKRENERLALQRSDHIGRHPFFIFADTTVTWDQLVPRLDEVYGPGVERRILGSFAVPDDHDGSDLSRVQADDRSISFPDFGDYYLHTSVGFFKILLLDPGLSDEDRILSVASFVAKNTVHSLADARTIRPVYKGSRFTPERLQPILFASDQPLKLHCGDVSRFLSHLLRQLGHDVRLVSLMDANGVAGHVVTEVFLRDQDRYAMLDADYGAVIRSEDDVLLAAADVVGRDETSRSAVKVQDIAAKRWLKPVYNTVEPTPNFSWTPETLAPEMALESVAYLKLLGQRFKTWRPSAAY